MPTGYGLAWIKLTLCWIVVTVWSPINGGSVPHVDFAQVSKSKITKYIQVALALFCTAVKLSEFENCDDFKMTQQ